MINIYDSPYRNESVKQSEQSDNNGKTGEFVQVHDGERREVVTLAVPEDNCYPQISQGSVARQRETRYQNIQVGLPAQ